MQVGAAHFQVDSPPGTYGDRVFVGGNYRLMRTIQDVRETVKDCGFTPIVVADFDMPPDSDRESSLLLLRQCKYAIFDVSLDGGHIAELERACDYGTITLCLYDAGSKDWPTASRMVTTNPLFRRNHGGFRTTRELLDRVERFLKGNRTALIE